MATLFTSELEEGMVTLTDPHLLQQWQADRTEGYGAYEEYHPDAFWQ